MLNRYGAVTLLVHTVVIRLFSRGPSVCSMRCTFYVDGGMFDPWVEELASLPSRHHAVTRQGTQWTVTDTWLSQLAEHDNPEACVVLTLICDEPSPSRRRHRRRLGARAPRR
jgi:hypothetical protein